MATGANGGVLQQIEAFLKARYRFRYNQATNKVEWKPLDKAEEVFTDMRDYDYNTVLRKIKYEGLSCSMTTLRTMLARILFHLMIRTGNISNTSLRGTGKRIISNSWPVQ